MLMNSPRRATRTSRSCDGSDFVEPLFTRRRFELLGEAQQSGHRNRLLIRPMVVASNCCPHRNVKVAGNHTIADGFRRDDKPGSRGASNIRIINNQGLTLPQALGKQSILAIRSFLHVFAYMDMRIAEILVVIGRLARALQADQDNCFKHDASGASAIEAASARAVTRLQPARTPIQFRIWLREASIHLCSCRHARRSRKETRVFHQTPRGGGSHISRWRCSPAG